MIYSFRIYKKIHKSKEGFAKRERQKIDSLVGFMSFVSELVNWLYVITCKKCGYISTEKLPESKAKEMVQFTLRRSSELY